MHFLKTSLMSTRICRARMELEASQLRGFCSLWGDRWWWLKGGWGQFRWTGVDGLESDIKGRISKTWWLFECEMGKKFKGDSWTWVTGWMVVSFSESGSTEEKSSFAKEVHCFGHLLSLVCQWDNQGLIPCWPLSVLIWNWEERLA